MTDTLTESKPDLDYLKSLLSESKQRGITKPVVEAFVESGELYTNLSANTVFAGQKPGNIRQNVNTVIKSDEWKGPELRVVIDRNDKDNPKVILINFDAFVAAGVEAPEEDNEQ